MTTTAHIIVFASETIGSGKSTAAMHVAIGLVRLGYTVASVDLDAEKGTLSEYMANRFEHSETSCPDLPSPTHMVIEEENINALKDNHKDGRDFLHMSLDALSQDFEFIVIDTQPSDTFFAHLAESYSDTLITVVTSSFAGLIETAQRVQALRTSGRRAANWIILHNRLSENHASAMQTLPGVKFVPGFAERDVFGELFPRGLTLLDLKETEDIEMDMAALAARQEVRQLLRAIGPEKLKGYPQKRRNPAPE